jgi:hypothetical protein
MASMNTHSSWCRRYHPMIPVPSKLMAYYVARRPFENKEDIQPICGKSDSGSHIQCLSHTMNSDGCGDLSSVGCKSNSGHCLRSMDPDMCSCLEWLPERNNRNVSASAREIKSDLECGIYRSIPVMLRILTYISPSHQPRRMKGHSLSTDTPMIRINFCTALDWP